MSRKKKLLLNTSLSIAYKIISVVCAFILPRLILSHYGSAVNGLAESISNFLGFITLLEMGITSVIDANLYKPLAMKKYDEVNDIFISSKRFFRRIAYIFIAYVLVLLVVYPLTVKESFDYTYSALLIAIIAISTFTQYYFGISYRILINADQRGYVVTILQGITIVLSTIISIVLIKLNSSIHIVKLAVSLIYAAQPVCFHFYAKRRYHLNTRKTISGEPIKQKWNGFAQHLAFIIATKTDIIVLTLFSSLENVSVYGVYALVLGGITTVFDALYIGISPMIGNMLVTDDNEKLNKVFNVYDWISHFSTTFLFTLCGILIVPFVKIYTRGITDANYVVPLFAILLTLAYAIQVLRTPYKTVVHAAGHFKQTQLGAIIEAALNVTISVLMVFKFGLIGVAIGTIVSMLFRTIHFVWYLSKNILHRSFALFVRSLLIDILCVAAILLPCIFVYEECSSYTDWIVYAFRIGLLGLFPCLAINMVFYKQTIKDAFTFLRKDSGR